MADIDLTRLHNLGLEDGRSAIERVARQLDDDLGIDYQWQDNTLHFDGQGADGHIEVSDQSVQVAINLSFFLSPMRSRIETEAERYLDEHLSP